MLGTLHVFILTISYFVKGDRECGLEHVYCHQNNVNRRTIDGSCNNLQYPNWGTAFSVYDRLIPAKYGRGDSLACSCSGQPLPNARCISTAIYTEETHPDPDFTSSLIQYGQLVAHDIGFMFITRPPTSCCNEWFRELDHTPSDCENIKIPYDDPHYTRVNATCMSVLKTVTNHDMACSLYLPYTAQISTVTAFLDLSVIYGSTDEVNKVLRTGKGGTILVNVRDNCEWLHSMSNPEDRDLFCPLIGDSGRCYLAGDERVNQNPHLTILSTLWTREHNRVARQLAKINPHWHDEKIFQVTRTILIAEHQHITYYELLPWYGGKDNLIKSGILFETDGFINDYNETMRPHPFNEFSHGSFRYYHSMCPGSLSLVDASGCPYRSIILRDHTNNPHFLEKSDNFDSLMRGMATQPPLSANPYCDPEMTNYFFPMFLKVGFDIKALDIQRSRVHGLGSYNDMREYCGLGRVNNFHQLLDVMDKEWVDKLAALYGYPDDIDLVVGGSLENPIPGTLAGPTFLCIMFEQFSRTRKADRFFFENFYTGFTHEQLREIRKSSISRLFCDNGNHVTHMQKKGFLQVSTSNPRVPCHTIPGPDLTLWREPCC